MCVTERANGTRKIYSVAGTTPIYLSQELKKPKMPERFEVDVFHLSRRSQIFQFFKGSSVTCHLYWWFGQYIKNLLYLVIFIICKDQSSCLIHIWIKNFLCSIFQMLKEKGYQFDIAYTSLLKRSVKTLYMVQEELDLHWIPVVRHWRLNERHYGALQGLNKSETAAKYGEAQVKVWFIWLRSHFLEALFMIMHRYYLD